jgi:hypothetical protein
MPRFTTVGFGDFSPSNEVEQILGRCGATTGKRVLVLWNILTVFLLVQLSSI